VGSKAETGTWNACRGYHETKADRHGTKQHAPDPRHMEIQSYVQGRHYNTKRIDCNGDLGRGLIYQCIAFDVETSALSFLCPPRMDEYVRTGVEPIVLKDIENPTTLETRLLDEDGRVGRSDRPNGNAFKAMRIVRGNEDIGSLFDVRMSAFEKLNNHG
jgi:hypothetical protein